jgi:hypothetical protein
VSSAGSALAASGLSCSSTLSLSAICTVRIMQDTDEVTVDGRTASWWCATTSTSAAGIDQRRQTSSPIRTWS